MDRQGMGMESQAAATTTDWGRGRFTQMLFLTMSLLVVMVLVDTTDPLMAATTDHLVHWDTTEVTRTDHHMVCQVSH
jgi:hypothetical protein